LALATHPTMNVSRFFPLRHCGILLFVLFCTGCLTIEEHYTFKKNGSGIMEYVVDMSATADLMTSLDKISDNKNDNSSPELGMEEHVKQLKAIDGIKKVRLKKEKEGYIQRVSFAFKDLSALNKALNVLMADSTGVQQTFFHWEGNTLVRTNNRHAEEMAGDTRAEDDSLLQSMKYKYSFKFQQTVASTDLAEGMTKEAPNAKTLDLSTDWSMIMKDPKALDLRITLDK
jgi:hypothetical protein